MRDPLRERNPIAPKVEQVPLSLTLDARSFEHLKGEALEEAGFLCELCRTPALDGIWSWEGNPIVGGIPQAELRPLRNDDRAVSLAGQPGFIGGVRMWSQYEKAADEYGFSGDERNWFVYYGALTHFHQSSDRHYLVTADSRLLEESEREKGFFRRGRYRLISIEGALSVAGLAMQAQGEVFYEAPQQGHSIHTSSYELYLFTSCDLISSRRRLFECMRRDEESQDDFRGTYREGLVRSVFDRVSDLLRARTRIVLQHGRHQDSGTLGEVLYDLRSMIASAAGLFDTIALAASKAYSIDLKGKGGDAAISLRRKVFIEALKAKGAHSLAATARETRPLLGFLWSLRNPILHREGLSGYTLHAPPKISSRISLTDAQAEGLKTLCAQTGEDVAGWGLSSDLNLGAALDAEQFSRRLTLATTESVDRLAFALADDRKAPRLRTTWTDEDRKAIRRFRWLLGLPSAEITTDGLPYLSGE